MSTLSRATVQTIWESSSRRLREWFVHRTGDAHVADDLVQETFLRVQSKLGTLRSGERLDAWVGRIASHVLADHGRTRARRALSIDVTPAEDGTAEPAALEPEEPDVATLVASWLEAFLAGMEPEDAALLRAVDLEGRPQVELARELGLSQSGARSRVQRARNELRRRLEACCSFDFDARGGLSGATRRSGSTCGCDAGKAAEP